MECRHNLVYWRNEAYLGVGPGAHSRLGDYRFWTVLSPRSYDSAADRWRGEPHLPWPRITKEELGRARTLDGWEHIDSATACSETMFLGLRLLDGMDLSRASAAVGIDLSDRYHSQIEELIDLGLLHQTGQNLRLTEPAYLIANQVFTRFID
jgi:oxygen-independent coproporphyrinogen-3 oxidase